LSTSTSTSPITAATGRIQPQAGPQEAFLASRADICIYGGAAGGGKTWALLLEPLRHLDNPHFGAVVFRRTSPQITNEGGLWDEAGKLYPQLGGTPRVGALEYVFRSGMRVGFRHLQHEDTKYDWQGGQIALIEFDELTHFTESQFWYMLSRNRSTAGVQPYVRATCNPEAESWVAKLLAWWIDPETGLPVPERAGAVRWFVRVNDRLEWADDPAELRARFPGIPPKSLSFVPARLSDNRALMAADPGYLANLMALPLVERERLLGGNWRIRPESGLVFNRSWFEVVRAAPAEGSLVRYWDKASVPGGGDYSCGVKMGRSPQGVYYVAHVLRGQWSSAERNAVMKQTAALDGPGVYVWVEQEGGSGGKESAEISVKDLAGYPVHAERVTGDKVSRAQAYSAQAEAGNVKLVSGDWNAAYLDELHAFPVGAHDDQVDASSGAFNKLALYHGAPVPLPSSIPNPERRTLKDRLSGDRAGDDRPRRLFGRGL
jgi:predicted phage terminase large subunit-like protein